MDGSAEGIEAAAGEKPPTPMPALIAEQRIKQRHGADPLLGGHAYKIRAANPARPVDAAPGLPASAFGQQHGVAVPHAVDHAIIATRTGMNGKITGDAGHGRAQLRKHRAGRNKGESESHEGRSDLVHDRWGAARSRRNGGSLMLRQGVARPGSG